MIDLFIMYACEWMYERPLVGLSKPPHSRDTMQTICLGGVAALLREGGGGYADFLVFPKTNAHTRCRLRQHEVVTSEVLPSVDGPVSFRAPVSHTA